MVKAKDIVFAEPKRLPTLSQLKKTHRINFNSITQQFDTQHIEIEVNGFTHILSGGTYEVEEFITDYYEADFSHFKSKFYYKLKRRITEKGFVNSIDGSTQKVPIRDLAFFANKERKYGRQVQVGRSRGNWIKTICYNVSITASQTDIISHFVNTVIQMEKLRKQDIIMLKFLKRVGDRAYAIYKIFKSVDVRQKQDLLFRINIYADGFLGRNDDYSEDIDRLELDIIEAIEGGCNKS